MALIISDQWSEALDPVIRGTFELAFNRRASVIPMLFNIQQSMDSDEEMLGVGAIGIDAWENYEQSGAVSEVHYDKGYKTTLTHKEYPVTIGVERKLLDDNKLPQILQIPRRLGDSAFVRRETHGASVFNNAFDSNFAGADSVELCDAAHPHSPDKTGSTQSNISTNALTLTNVASARETMMAFTDDNNEIMGVTPDTLLVPPELEDEALVITRSLQNPDNANNAINPQAGRFRVVPWHYLTDANNWFLIDSGLMRESLWWFDRMPLTIRPKVEDKTIKAHWIAYMRYSYGWSDWRWVYGHSVT
jgi:hypothetical protein